MEIVDPGTGGTPTIPEITEATSPSDLTNQPENTETPLNPISPEATSESVTEEPNAGCGASVGFSALCLMLLTGTALLPSRKHH